MGQAKINKQQRLDADAAFAEYWYLQESWAIHNLSVSGNLAPIVLAQLREEARSAWFAALKIAKPHSGDK